jgi:hypothetical protein
VKFRWPFRRPTGGTMPPHRPDSDTVPALLSEGRYTTLRPGETPSEAMGRLLAGEDLDPPPGGGGIRSEALDEMNKTERP